ncbi:DUF1329 domain-containing protein [Pelomonas sp. SE-A7]|uniref:DUF1329 domain-containing protein n=1 Tax=Pelomonas sp. SE-A7 TaxID=3054953 RepID=UPI00259C7C0C|nr:DUF1329 domain-containing protein [Pelomonas sp. SE-A7]MDM4764462.1 DUF1329 domain-containing protein [Pelomonas sp. SE-A7]
MKNQSINLLLALMAVGSLPALAGVTAEEAKQLGGLLTGVGAEKGANKDGSIPAYTGGLTTLPAGYKSGDGIRPNPYSSEKPRYSIDAKSLAQYADKLTEGSKALLQKYPASFRIDVYPTQRSVAFPKWVIEGTAKNAVKAKTTNDGRSIADAHAGFPFPIPKNGYEAMWNHLLRFNGQAYEAKYRNLNVDASGRPILATEGVSTQEYPYWDPAKTSDTYWKIKLSYTGPARRAGEGLLIIDPLDVGEKQRRAWTYLPGQRRVKVAPDLAFDTPNPGTAGASTFDDTFIFNGSMDRFDFKLVGKKEMIVPYNAYAAVYGAKQDDLLKAKHLNPDLVRWELHRVWVVEATLREGKRHVYSKRTFYLDEDSWAALASDSYDARGQLYRAGFAYMAPSYDLPAPYTDMFGHYDLIGGVYALTGFIAETGGLRHTKPLAEREWTPDSLAGAGIR